MSLPALQTRHSTSLYSMPRRYEDMKAPQIQYLTHKQIVELGEDVHKRGLQRSMLERSVAVREAEQAVWSQAEVEKQKALKKLLAKTESEHEKHLKRLLKSHKEALKQEALRVEGEMKQLAIDSVKQEREEGEQRLQAAVERTIERCELEKQEAVNAARIQEKHISAQEIKQLQIEHEEKMKAALQRANEEQQVAIEKIIQAMNQKEQVAVAEARKDEQHKGLVHLQHVNMQHEDIAAELNARIVELQMQKDAVSALLEATRAHKERVIEEFQETRKEFQKFIDRTQPFHISESKYVMPSAKSIDRQLCL